MTDSRNVISAIESHISRIIRLQLVAWTVAGRNIVSRHTSSICICFVVTHHVLAWLDEPGCAFGVLWPSHVHLKLTMHAWYLLCVVVIEVVIEEVIVAKVSHLLTIISLVIQTITLVNVPTWHLWEHIAERKISLEALLVFLTSSHTIPCSLVSSHDIGLVEHFGLRIKLALTLQILLLVKQHVFWA